jgi:signal transduction histidine kinase
MRNSLAVDEPLRPPLFRPTTFGIGLAVYAGVLAAAAVVVALLSTDGPASIVNGVAFGYGAAEVLIAGGVGVLAVLVHRLSPGLGWLMLILTVSWVGEPLNSIATWPSLFAVGPTWFPIGAVGVWYLPLVGTTVLAALYAADRCRRLGRWGVPVAVILAGSVVASVVLDAFAYGQFAMFGYEVPNSFEPPAWWSWRDPLLAGWQPFVLVLLGLLGDLRPAVRRARHRGIIEGQRRMPTTLVRTLLDELVPGRAAAQTAVAEMERARLASDLHAEVFPLLARAIARSERGALPAELTGHLRDMEKDLRALMSERRLVILEEFGLVPALEWLAEQTQDRFEVEVELDVEEADDQRPPRDVERAAFRIAQLALDNAVRHGNPRKVALATRSSTRRVDLSVRDDGAGIAPEALRAATLRNRAGLADMRIEADRVGAALDVRSARPGTEVTFSWAA